MPCGVYSNWSDYWFRKIMRKRMAKMECLAEEVRRRSQLPRGTEGAKRAKNGGKMMKTYELMVPDGLGERLEKMERALGVDSIHDVIATALNFLEQHLETHQKDEKETKRANIPTVFEAKDELETAVDVLDPVSRWMLVRMARRLVQGQNDYGRWDREGHPDYHDELVDELTDAIHYTLALQAGMTDGKITT